MTSDWLPLTLLALHIVLSVFLYINICRKFKEQKDFTHNLIKRIDIKVPGVQVIEQNVKNLEKPKPQVYIPSRDKVKKLEGKGPFFT